MRIAKTVILVAVLMLGGFLLYHRNQINRPSDLFALLGQRLSILSIGTNWRSEAENPSVIVSDRISVASFKLAPQVHPIDRGQTVALLTDICLDFDVIALQMETPDPQLLANLISAINEQSDSFKYIQDVRGDGYAILFNSNTIELVSNHHYSVNDPERLFHHPPLVAWFRTRQPDAQEAFTFTLANFQIAPERTVDELQHLETLFRAIRGDGRGEDDILLVGDFRSGDRQLDKLQRRAGLVQTISSRSTNVDQNEQLDNILFHQSATVEYDSGGVVDFMRRYNLRLSDAMQISDRNPVWAEFSIYEGKQPAARPHNATPFRRQRQLQHPSSIPILDPPDTSEPADTSNQVACLGRQSNRTGFHRRHASILVRFPGNG